VPRAVPRCAICSNARRAAIEAAVAVDGSSLIEVAEAFGVTKAALAKHVATHDNLAPVAPTTKAKPKVAKAPPSPFPADDGEDVVQQTARAHIENVLGRIWKLVDEADVDEVLPRDKAVLLTAATTAIKLLGQLTGELGASEATVFSSPHWKKLQAELVDALRPYPDALRAVAARLERIERAEAA
jgi:hypothetical protein